MLFSLSLVGCAIACRNPMCMSPLVQSELRDRFGFSGNHTPPSAAKNRSVDQFGGREDEDADWMASFGRGQYVVTDSGALEFMVSKFHRFPNTSEAAAAALPAGIDLNSGCVALLHEHMLVVKQTWCCSLVLQPPRTLKAWCPCSWGLSACSPPPKQRFRHTT